MPYLSVWQHRLVASLALLSFMLSSVAANAIAAPLTDYSPNEILVKLNPSANVNVVAAMHRLKVSHSNTDQIDAQPIYRLQIADGQTPSDKVAELQNDRLVAYAEPNYVGELPEARQRSSWVVGDGVEGYAAQWAPAALRLPEAHAITRGANVIVAVLDTGVDASHPALVDHLAPGYDFVDLDNDPSEVGVYGVNMAYGHGTHVAGLVALAAPDAKIMPLRTLGPDGIGTIWMQVRAIRYAIEHGANVINLSYSFRNRSKVLDDILAQASCTTGIDDTCRSKTRPGVIITAASGNSGTNDREYPAADNLPGILAVAASTETNTLASFSTYGSWVQVAAPGDRIVSTVPGGGYATWSGTSMAAPLAAGSAALLRAAFPDLRPVDVVSRMITTASRIKGLVPRRIDAAAALKPASPPTP